MFFWARQTLLCKGYSLCLVVQDNPILKTGRFTGALSENALLTLNRLNFHYFLTYMTFSRHNNKIRLGLGFMTLLYAFCSKDQMVIWHHYSFSFEQKEQWLANCSDMQLTFLLILNLLSLSGPPLYRRWNSSKTNRPPRFRFPSWQG